ncbi:hypothetical protein SLS58_010897 [Diplodia intermedia]|uniref:Uncharacterized protein n=1 Tax=Diplodia intermedia TaxID=856260 RepID=A0ABR3T3L3_9PEZI
MSAFGRPISIPVVAQQISDPISDSPSLGTLGDVHPACHLTVQLEHLDPDGQYPCVKLRLTPLTTNIKGVPGGHHPHSLSPTKWYYGAYMRFTVEATPVLLMPRRPFPLVDEWQLRQVQLFKQLMSAKSFTLYFVCDRPFRKNTLYPFTRTISMSKKDIPGNLNTLSHAAIPNAVDSDWNGIIAHKLVGSGAIRLEDLDGSNKVECSKSSVAKPPSASGADDKAASESEDLEHDLSQRPAVSYSKSAHEARDCVMSKARGQKRNVVFGQNDTVLVPRSTPPSVLPMEGIEHQPLQKGKKRNLSPDTESIAAHAPTTNTPANVPPAESKPDLQICSHEERLAYLRTKVKESIASFRAKRPAAVEPQQQHSLPPRDDTHEQAEHVNQTVEERPTKRVRRDNDADEGAAAIKTMADDFLESLKDEIESSWPPSSSSPPPPPPNVAQSTTGQNDRSAHLPPADQSGANDTSETSADTKAPSTPPTRPRPANAITLALAGPPPRPTPTPNDDDFVIHGTALDAGNGNTPLTHAWRRWATWVVTEHREAPAAAPEVVGPLLLEALRAASVGDVGGFGEAVGRVLEVLNLGV